jgi:RNA polymerase sigma-70 factor (ECF subfamily)
MGGFATTRWSLILEARAQSTDARAALSQLCSAYRAPVLAFVRQRGMQREQAEDLTQEFFEHFLAERIHQGADPERGRFRSYLLAALRHFLSDRSAAAATIKRGGGFSHESMDESHDLAGDDTPERAFERRWALTVLARAMDRLRQEAEEAGKRALFDGLQEFLLEQPSRDDYERVSEKLGMRRNTLAVAVHRMRERLRELVRAELADTVTEAREVEAELGALRQVLGGAAV